MPTAVDCTIGSDSSLLPISTDRIYSYSSSSLTGFGRQGDSTQAWASRGLKFFWLYFGPSAISVRQISPSGPLVPGDDENQVTISSSRPTLPGPPASSYSADTGAKSEFCYQLLRPSDYVLLCTILCIVATVNWSRLLERSWPDPWMDCVAILSILHPPSPIQHVTSLLLHFIHYEDGGLDLSCGSPCHI